MKLSLPESHTIALRNSQVDQILERAEEDITQEMGLETVPRPLMGVCFKCLF